MSTLLTKPILEITQVDVEALAAGDGVQEHDHLEYKEDLDQKDGSCFDGNLGKWKLQKEAKRDILKEVVAFANSRGGTLILGIRETKDAEAKIVYCITSCAGFFSRRGAEHAGKMQNCFPWRSWRSLRLGARKNQC